MVAPFWTTPSKVGNIGAPLQILDYLISQCSRALPATHRLVSFLHYFTERIALEPALRTTV